MNLSASRKVVSIREGAARRNPIQAPVEPPAPEVRIRGTIPVFSGDTKVGYADAEQAAELLGDPRNIRRGTRRTLRAIQLGAPIGANMQLSPAGGNSTDGQLTTAESWDNPAGVRSFRSIPRHLRPNFTRVIGDCLKAA